MFKCTLDVFQIQSANTPTVGRRWRLWVKIVKYQREWGLYLVNHHSKWYGLSFSREDGGTDVRERKKILRVEEKRREKEGCTRTGDQMLQAPEIWLNFWKGQIAKCEMRDGAVPVSKRWKPDWLNASEIIRFFWWGSGGWFWNSSCAKMKNGNFWIFKHDKEEYEKKKWINWLNSW